MTTGHGGLNLEQIRKEMRQQRFGPNMDTSLLYWINLREGQIWSDSEWPFKRLMREAVTAENGYVGVPDQFWKAANLEAADGTTLGFLLPEEYELMYPIGSDAAGAAAHFTILNSQVLLGPAVSGTFYLSYDKRVCHYDNTGFLVSGPMFEADDYPPYPVEYHYMLVVGAMASGLKVQNDPTWDALEQEFQQMLGTMREDLLPPDQYRNAQFGRDQL